MNTLVNGSLVVRVIQVSGGQCFEGKHWREAILCYLFGMWKNDTAITHRPKIALGDVVLRLVGGSYILYGISSDDFLPPVLDGELVITTGKQSDVEIGLVKFVKDNKIRRLTIALGDQGSVILRKGKSRSDLLVWAACLPTTQEMVNHCLSH